MQNGNLKILIAEDSEMLSKAIKQFVQKNYPNATIEITNDGKAVLRKLKRSRFDLLVLDLKMPPKDRGGYLVVEKIFKGKVPNPPKVAVYTDFFEFNAIMPIVRQDVKVIVAKGQFDYDLPKALEAALNGQKFYSPNVVRELEHLDTATAEPEKISELPELSVRQMQVLELTCHDALTTAEISEKLGISTTMIDRHKANVCERFGDHFDEPITRMQQVSAKLIQIGYRFDKK